VSDPQPPSPETPDPESAPQPSQVPPPPLEPEPPLGLDRAWGELTSAGRAVVVLVSAALVATAAVGIGLAVAGGDGGDDTVVLAETSADALTIEVSPEEDPGLLPPVTVDPDDPSDEELDPDLTDSFEEEPTDGFETVDEGDDEGIGTEAEPSTEEDPAVTAADPSAPTQVFSSDEGDDIGAVTIEEPSTLVWTSGGGQMIIQDLNSGATLVDEGASSGEIDLEPGEYDLLLSADADWTVEIRPR
jgi:hypothetical protein